MRFTLSFLGQLSAYLDVSIALTPVGKSSPCGVSCTNHAPLQSWMEEI